MPKDLKIAGPTFYIMTKAILREQMERNIFAYVDDIVVMTRKKETQLQDLAETFANMKRAQFKLNPEANPDKINAIVHMKPPGSRKKVQRLTGRIAALNRFMAKLAKQSLSFFKVLRGADTFKWDSE
jgi:hypothetical protein